MMGHPMMSDGESCSGLPALLCIPAPMAMFGMIVAFMFGVTMGTMMGRKRAMMMAGPMHMGPHGWKHRMMSHHHHTMGAPACKCGVPEDEWAEKAPLEDVPE